MFNLVSCLAYFCFHGTIALQDQANLTIHTSILNLLYIEVSHSHKGQEGIVCTGTQILIKSHYQMEKNYHKGGWICIKNWIHFTLICLYTHNILMRDILCTRLNILLWNQISAINDMKLLTMENWHDIQLLLFSTHIKLLYFYKYLDFSGIHFVHKYNHFKYHTYKDKKGKIKNRTHTFNYWNLKM